MKPAVEYIKYDKLAITFKEKIAELMIQYAKDALDDLQNDLERTGHVTDDMKMWIKLNKDNLL